MIVPCPRGDVHTPVGRTDVDSLGVGSNPSQTRHGALGNAANLGNSVTAPLRRREEQFIIFTTSEGQIPLSLAYKRTVASRQGESFSFNLCTNFTSLTYVTEILKKSVADVDHRGRQALGGEVSADLQSTRRTKKARLSFFSMGPTFSLP